jgi:AcrR family transcriptional regulator
MSRGGVRRRISAPERRARIVAAALEAFGAMGYDGTGLERIAEMAGVTRAVLYDHFDSKKALYLEVLTEQSGVFLGHVGATITSGGPPEQRMRATVDAVFTYAERYPHAWRLLFGHERSADPDIAAAHASMHGTRVEVVAAMLAPDSRAIGMDPDSVQMRIMVEMLIASLRGSVDWWQTHRTTSRAELLEAAMDLLWRGLGRATRLLRNTKGSP